MLLPEGPGERSPTRGGREGSFSSLPAPPHTLTPFFFWSLQARAPETGPANQLAWLWDGVGEAGKQEPAASPTLFSGLVLGELAGLGGAQPGPQLQHSTAPAPAQAQVPILCCCHREPRRTAACRCHGVGMKLQPLHNCNCLFSPHTFLKYFFLRVQTRLHGHQDYSSLC